MGSNPIWSTMLLTVIRNLWSGLTSLVFPARCGLCGRDTSAEADRGLCTVCRSGIEIIRGPVCEVCGKPQAGVRCGACAGRRVSYSCARAAGSYEGTLRDCIHGLKYAGRRCLARPLAKLMAEAIAKQSGWDCDGIVPVPLDRSREHGRGYNQATELARELGGILGRPVMAGALRRTRRVEPQTFLSREERLRNVAGVFEAVRVQELQGKKLLLVDDVLTTGATADECAGALLKAGAREVLVITAARTP